MSLFKQFWQSPLFVRLVGLLCLLGAIVDVGLLGKDLMYGSALWPLHVSFLLLYIGQIVFILLQERYVCVLTVLQGLAALWTTADFIFTPLLQLVGLVYLVTNPSLDSRSTYEYIFVSAAFTLQMASAAYLWMYFKAVETAE